ncbi:MAG: hypothetical protein HY867_13650 [Chloroflexi bacterium]|nr:hypothetical protein [Chloroflexota bacterium]
MGDGSEMADIGRFMRSVEGHAHLEKIRQGLRGRGITDVGFKNGGQWICTVLYLDDGSTLETAQPEHEIGALQGKFGNVMEREYYVDYPERRT